MFWWILVYCFFLIWLIKYLFRKKQNNHKRDLPGFKIHPIIQNLYMIRVFLSVQDTNVALFKGLYNTCKMFFGYGIVRLYIGLRPLVICFSSDSFQAVLNSNTNIEKKFGYDFLKPWLMEGLLTSNGSKWRTRRKLLTHSFHFRILDDFRPILNENAKILVEVLREFDGKTVDIIPYMSRCALDVVCETTLGIQLNSMRNKDCQYLHGIVKIGEVFPYRILRPWYWSDRIFYMTRKGKQTKDTMDKLKEFAIEIILKRKSSFSGTFVDEENYIFSSKKLALLDLLLYHQENGSKISDNDILEEVNAFMFAGHDTTAHALSWTLFLLGNHSQIQDKLLKEIDDIFGDDIERNVTIEDIKNLKYLECVIKESLRLFPSVPLMSRDLSEDVKMDLLYLKEQLAYFIPIYFTEILTYLRILIFSIRIDFYQITVKVAILIVTFHFLRDHETV
ncbi:cytochrome P450 4V2-like isoform X2 [Centruroides sculpturatus]|uniref:cytochrome P450 4V2-like isoform X2 n=1 Tax=Centruroides sculpturatus TaxID=218467 RepID=UPI000C6E1804|nr:cytochrome P450 4V2-like isoform X2 [Centruroides sculpturatus]